MVGVVFGGLGVDVDDGGKNVVADLLLLGVDVIKESLMGSSGTKIILILVEVAFEREGLLWKMFVDEACEKTRPLSEEAPVDGGDEGIFDGAEGLRVEVFGEFMSGGVILRMPLAWFGWECVYYC